MGRGPFLWVLQKRVDAVRESGRDDREGQDMTEDETDAGTGRLRRDRVLVKCYYLSLPWLDSGLRRSLMRLTK